MHYQSPKNARLCRLNQARFHSQPFRTGYGENPRKFLSAFFFKKTKKDYSEN